MWVLSLGAVAQQPHHSLHYGLQGNPCSSAWSTSFPSFCTDLGDCRAASHIFSLLSSLAAVASVQQLFLPFSQVYPCVPHYQSLATQTNTAALIMACRSIFPFISPWTGHTSFTAHFPTRCTLRHTWKEQVLDFAGVAYISILRNPRFRFLPS